MRKTCFKLPAMLLLLIMILVLLVPASARADGGSGAWPQFQNDLYNDGVTTDTAPLSAPAAAWEQQVGNVAMSGVDAAPLVAGGQVFVLDALGKVWDFDARTGTQVWATQLSSTGMKFQLATPAYDSGTLYVATNDGHVYALDAAGGNILWQVALPLAAYSQLNSPVKYDSGKLYVGAWNSNASTDEYYYCLNAATGQPGIGTQYQLPNSASPGGYYWAGACIAGNDLVFGSENSTLTCLDKDNGTLLDSVSLQVYNSGAQQVRSSVSYDPATGLVFLTDQATTAGCCWAFSLDAASGKLTPNWHTQLGFSTSTPAVYGGRVYVGTGIYSIQGGLYCLDEASGSVVWKFLPTTGGGAASVPGVQASPVISVPNSTPYIYFPTICEHSTVYCLDQNGNQVWQFNDTDSTYTLQGVAVADGWLYFGNDNGWVYALQTAPPGTVAVTGVTLNKTSDTITVGGSDQLTAIIAPTDATNQSVTWTSSNSSVATVVYSGASCTITAVGTGTSTITATTADGGFTAACAVTVSAGSGGGSSGTITVQMEVKDENNQVRFNQSLSLQPGTSVMGALLAAAQIDPSMNPQIDYNNPEITGGYVESLYGEASPWGAQPDGWVYFVNGVEPGEGAAIYKLNAGDGILWRWSWMRPVTGVALNKTSDTIAVGGSDQLTATVAPTDATNQSVTWTSSNSSVATVGATTGMVTGVAAGSATITATTADGGFTATCTVTVSTGGGSGGGTATASVTGVALNKTSDTIAVGGSDQLTATVAPTDATNQSVTWTSSNSSVATVGATTGMVTGVAAGTATITATTADGGFTATCAVTVSGQSSVQPQLATQTPAATVFTDVPSNYWAREAIERLAAGGYLKGYPDGTFRPDQAVTRAEFAAMLVKVLGLPEQTGKAVFSDVYAGDWYYGSVSTALAQGLIAGYGDGRFGPNDLVTREQVASMIGRALAKQASLEAVAPGSGSAPSFKDAGEISPYALAAVAAVTGRGLVHGYQDGTFRPQAPATRAECAVILSKLLS